MIVRPATASDADAIARVHVASWQTTYRGILADDYLARMSVHHHAANHRALMAEARTFYLVAQDRSDGVIGFVNAGPERNSDPDFTGEIYALYLLQQHQRKGLGQMLVQFAALRLRAMGHHSLLIWVLDGNPAEGFYQRLGGRRLRTAPVDIAGQSLQEIAYVWPDTVSLL